MIKKLYKKEKNLFFAENERLRIGFVGVGPYSGTTTLSAAFATWIAESGKLSMGNRRRRVAFVQIDQYDRETTNTFEAFSMEKRFGEGRYTDIYDLIKQGFMIKGVENFYGGVNWIFLSEENTLLNNEEKTAENILNSNEKKAWIRLMGGDFGEITIYDMGQGHNKEDFLLDMDYVIGVVDPMPSKILKNRDDLLALEKVRRGGTKVEWIINKANRGVNKRQVRAMVRGGNISWVPIFPIERTYFCDFNCKFLWEDSTIKGFLWEFFAKNLGFSIGI